jgi:hypothetical protein
MKKIYMSLVAVMAAFVLNAQVNVTFQVDMADYLKIAGNTLKTVKIAGQFGAQNATAKGVAMVDWDPKAAPVFTKVAGSANTWQTVITFPAAAKGQKLAYKFLNTADSWGACGTDQECMDATATTCSNQPNDDNRLLTIPTANTVAGYKWGTCTKLSVGVGELLLDNKVSISPNPANDQINVAIEGTSTYTVELTSLTGQVLSSVQNVTNNAVIERNDIAAGLYFVVIRSAEGKFQTQKVIFE